MDGISIEGWKRCSLKYENNILLIAGAFAGYYGPLSARQDCLCEKLECWCGFSSHNTKIGAMRYRPLKFPIAQVSMSENIRFGGGRMKEYIISYSQKVSEIFWPKICLQLSCLNTVTSLVVDKDGNVRPACFEHGGNVIINDFSNEVGIGMTWLSSDYSNWAKKQIKIN
jgi:hypothetical protein